MIAIRRIDVGVDTFSLTLSENWLIFGLFLDFFVPRFHLNKRERTEKEQMSTPLPATALKTPPTCRWLIHKSK